MQDQDIRWLQRFANFNKALAKLAEVFEDREDDLSELEQEGMIQRFEYTFELAWKTLQDLLRYKGYVDIAGPNPVLEQAFKDGYLTDAVGWKAMKKSRELSSHTYDSETAEAIAESIRSSYYKLLVDLAKRLEAERGSQQNSLFTP
jgi:nucleotidyltransferase substrate binding protein (TIGR01987 family)